MPPGRSGSFPHSGFDQPRRKPEPTVRYVCADGTCSEFANLRQSTIARGKRLPRCKCGKVMVASKKSKGGK